jgi:hypothetical protein
MLQTHFRGSTFVLMQRNPYAVAEGIRRRTQLPLDRCVQHWIRCARQQIVNQNALQRVTRFNYEDLSARPEYCCDEIRKLLPELSDLDLEKEVSVQSIEGKVRRPIINYNEQQIGRLSAEDLQAINGRLDQAPEVMTFFGYSYVRP